MPSSIPSYAGANYETNQDKLLRTVKSSTKNKWVKLSRWTGKVGGQSPCLEHHTWETLQEFHRTFLETLGLPKELNNRSRYW